MKPQFGVNTSLQDKEKNNPPQKRKRKRKS